MNKYYIITYFIILFANLPFSYAAELDLNALEITLEDKKNIVAQGEVEAVYLEHRLKSDYLKYNKELGEIYSSGNIRYEDKNNNLFILADKINSNRDFTTINADNIFARLSNGDSFIAKYFKKKEQKSFYRKASYTACNICANGQRKTPQWQIDGSKILYDEAKQNIYITHAFFKVYKVPVLYLPKLIMPGPKVKKRSGLLTLKYESSSLLGNQVTVPLFFNLAPNYDLTYSPIIFSKNNIFHEVNFRYMNKLGNLNLDAGYLKENNQLRQKFAAENINIANDNREKWYLDLESNFNYKNFNIEIDALKISSKTFLERYKDDFMLYDYSKLNISNINLDQEFILGFGRIYNLSNKQRISELPHISYKKNIKFKQDINYNYHIDYVNLYEKSKIDRHRILYKDALSKKIITAGGSVLEAKFNNLFRLYYNDDKNNNDFYLNYVPQLSLNAKKPYVKQGKIFNYLFAPQLSLVATQKNTNSSKVSNLDAATSYINHANLLNSNKNSGADVLEEGVRFSYGIKEALYHDNFTLSNFIGQAFYKEKQDKISRVSGIKKDFSDIIGNLKFDYKNHVSYHYNYKLRQSDFAPYHHQMNLNLSAKKLTANIGYNRYKYNILESNAVFLNYLSGGISYLDKDKFKVSASHTRNLLDKTTDPQSGSVNSTIELELYGDCITYLFSVKKDFITTDNIKPELEFMFNFIIKGF